MEPEASDRIHDRAAGTREQRLAPSQHRVTCLSNRIRQIAGRYMGDKVFVVVAAASVS